MNVRDNDGVVHHLVDETRRLLCGHSETALEWRDSPTDAAVTCRGCARLLADELRRAGPSGHDAED
jgi:hypothetical protein